MMMSHCPSPAVGRRRTEDTDSDDEEDAFFENAISDEEDGAGAQTRKAIRFDQPSQQPNKSKSIMMVGKSVVQRLDRNASSIKTVLTVFVPFALALALTNFGSAIMLIKYLKTTEVGSGGNLVGVGGGSPIVATRGSTETFVLEGEPSDLSALASNRFLTEESPDLSATLCPVSVAEKIFQDCEESISVHLKKQCRSGTTKIFALCGSGGGAYSTEDDNTEGMRYYSYDSIDATVMVSCPLNSEGDNDTCEIDFEPTMPSPEDEPCECDYECDSGFCDLETSTCTDYETYLGGLNITDDSEANSTQTQLQTYLVMADSLITYEAFDELKPFLQNTTATSCEGVMEEFANQLGLSLDDLSSIQDYLFSDDQINEIADFCEALEDGTVLPITNNADSLATPLLSQDDASDLLKQIQDMASEGQLSSEEVVESLSTGRRRLTTVGNITHSPEVIEALFENVDPRAIEMLQNTFTETLDQTLKDIEDLLTPANPPEEHHNVFFGETRFLLQDKFRSGTTLDQKINDIHREHAERRALRVHQGYVENTDRARRLISSHMEQFSHHRRRLAATYSCDEDGYNCGSEQLDGALSAIEEAFDFEVFDNVFKAIDRFGNARDTVDDTNLVITLVHAGLFAAQYLPVVGTAFKPAEAIVNKMKTFVSKLDKKLTDAEKKVVDKIDEALNTTVTRTAQFVGLLDGTAGTMDLVGDVLGMTCNAELVEQITDFDFMSTSAQNIVNDASKGISTAGHAVADALGVVNAIVSTGAWDTFNDVLGIADGFAKLVRPVVDPLSPITDLLRKEIKTPWIGKVYAKKNLGRVGCRSKSDVGYDSKKGAFGDKCWERCPAHHDEIKGITPQCKPKCRLNYYKSKRDLVFGCSNGRSYTVKLRSFKKKKKGCGSGYWRIPFTNKCMQHCPSGTWPSGLTKCQGYHACNSQKGFSAFPGSKNKFCRPPRRNKKSHRTSCAKYGVPARIDFFNNCMKKCLPGEGETPIGLCVKKGELVFSIADIVDLLAAFFKKVGAVIMKPIEATIGKLLEVVFNAILGSIKGLQAFAEGALPDIPVPALPAPPSIPKLDSINNFVANAEKIVNIPEQYFDKLAEKIPDLPELPSASAISAQIDDFVSASKDVGEIAANVTSLLGMVSGCKQTTKLKVPSLISLFKTLNLPGTNSWQDCNIEIPVCSQLDFADASSDKMNEIEEIFGKLGTVTEVFGRRRRKLNVFKDWQWYPLPIQIGKLLAMSADYFFPDTMDTLKGRKAHLGTRTNILGKGQIPLSNLGTDKATFNQYFVEYEIIQSLYPEIGIRDQNANGNVQFDLRIKAQVSVRFRFSRIQGSQVEIRDPILNTVLSSPIKFREMLQNSLGQNRALVRFLKERTMGSIIRTEEKFDPSDPLEVTEEETKIPFRCIEGDSIPFACNTRESYCDIACDHLLRLQNGPASTIGPETRGHDCSATYIASRINSLNDAEWGEKDIVEWATSCSSAYNRIYTDAYKYVDGRKTSAKSFKRTMDDYLKATYGAEKWTEYHASIYKTDYGDLFLNTLKKLELDFPLSLALNLFSMIPGLDVQFPGYASFNSTRGMWEGGGVPSASQVRWLFGLGMGWTRLNNGATRDSLKGSNLFSKTEKATKNLDAVSDTYFVDRRKEMTLWFSLDEQPKLADIWLGKITWAPALDASTLMPYAQTDTFNVIPAKAVFYPIASLRNCITGQGACSGLG